MRGLINMVIESPIGIKEGRVTSEVVYLTAMDEGKYTIAQANEELDKNVFVSELINAV